MADSTTKDAHRLVNKAIDPDKLNEPPAYRGEIVDVHTHLFPRKLFAAIRSWFAAVDWDIPYPYQTEQVIELLRGWGVTENWALTYAHKPGVAEDLNRWMGRTQQRFSGVRGFATVHPEDDDPQGIIKRALDQYGLNGLKLHAEVQKLAVDDHRLDGVFALLEERRLPCVLHSGDAPYPYSPPNLRFERTEQRLKRQPNLVCVIAHLGAYQTESYLQVLNQYPNLHLEVSFTNFPGSAKFDTDLLRPFADRLLFGSDFPNLTFTYADQVAAWLKLDWVREHAEDFFCNNARRLLPLSGKK